MWNSEDHRASQDQSKRKYRHWSDMASRHYDKCGRCAEIGRYGEGCDTYHSHLDKADKHAKEASASGSRAYKLEQEKLG